MDALIRTIEELSMNAWPALITLVSDGWVLRFSAGYTRRANSVHPLYPTRRDVTENVVVCESAYRDRGLSVAFKLTSASQPSDLEAALVKRGYEEEARTGVHIVELVPDDDVPTVEIETNWERAGAWREAFHRMGSVATEHEVTHEQILAAISLPAGYASVREDGQIVGCGVGVVQDGWLGVFDVMVDERARRDGHGGRLMRGLMSWGSRMGASRAYLQVMQGNVPALRLYAALGFREAYEYWYRVKR